MKIENYSEVRVELTHDDLVNLLSTALSGNDVLSVFISDVNKPLCNDDKSECYEDKCADVLLNGGYISACDLTADGEVYGSVCENYVDEDCDGIYKLTLERIGRGILECLFAEDEYYSKSANMFIHESPDFDMEDAYAIMQVCMFGEVIYG